jgi:hypothetical protein
MLQWKPRLVAVALVLALLVFAVALGYIDPPLDDLFW